MLDLQNAVIDRCVGAAWGLALGDSLGFPADQHRTIRDPWVRSVLWKAPVDLDAAQVIRTVTPFVLNALDVNQFAPTDDAETFAVAARTLLATPERTAASFFDTWREIMDEPDVWCGPAARSALLNARSGLVPPATGSDNPAFYDDTVLAGALAVGMAFAGAPDTAETVASELAQITHAHDGIVAARVFARLVADLVNGQSPDIAWGAAIDIVDKNSWLGSGFADAHDIIAKHDSFFSALPALGERFAPRTYSHPGTVTETLPLSFAITQLAGTRPDAAIPAALSIARHQDSLPALVGSICGAVNGAASFGAEWTSRIDTLVGVCVPNTAGLSLRELATSLGDGAS